MIYLIYIGCVLLFLNLYVYVKFVGIGNVYF